MVARGWVPLVLWKGTKLGELGKLGKSSMCQGNQTPHHHLVQTPKEELQFCVKVSTHPTHRCKLYTHSLCGSQTQNSSHCSKQDTQVAELYQTNDLSGNMRGAMAEVSAR